MKRATRRPACLALLLCLAAITGTATVSRASSWYEFEGEAVVIARSQIPDPGHYVKKVAAPKRDSFERVLRVEKLTKTRGHGVTLNKGSILFVQITADKAKSAVGYYPIVLKGGEATLKSLKPGQRITFSYTGHDSVGPGLMVGSAQLTVTGFVKTPPPGKHGNAATRPSKSASLTVVNPGFEADRYTHVHGYARQNGGKITGWTWRGSVGLNPTWRAPAQRRGPVHSFTDNGIIPQGKQAAFIHNAGQLSQKIAGFRKGHRYVVTYRENARHNNAPKRNPRLKVTLGGEVIVSEHAVTPVEEIGRHTLPYHAVTSAPFTASADGAFELVFQATHADRVAVLLDDVQIVEVE